MADDEGTPKVTGIRQIVRLKEILQKWQLIALNPRGNSPPPDHNHHQKGPGGISPAINKRLKNSYILCESDEESCYSPDPPPDVPEGYLAVYVGPELRRFIIPTTHLGHPVFKVLLEKAEEEFGFEHKGGLTIPCEIETFKYLLKCMDTNHNPHADHNSEEDLSSVEE
ncbi:Auxin-induced protein [Macleaya cordata]|uniref:Auxin-induced protein n=1 Tax=Macleaya cordata TaxID=56857 RepID=A0A200QPG6_MACCD|nr:Auxin-induced protein [Macleaya cordata]